MILVEIISGLMVLAGCAFCIIGAVGMLRFPDFYSRTHAASITDTMGAGLVLWGLMLYAGFSFVSVKLGMVAVLLLVTSPTAGHALVKAAYANGVAWTRGRDARFDTDAAEPVRPAELEVAPGAADRLESSS